MPHKAFMWDKKITLAVRVYDQAGEGGIVHGNIAVMIDQDAVFTDLDLQGDWKFSTGDCGDPGKKVPEYQTWDEILVPGIWEDQGYKNYNGLACYAVEFDLDGQFEGDRMVLMLGRIDDLEMVYINDILIGQTGELSSKSAGKYSDMYKQKRGYYIPEGVLNDNGKNVLIVKVLDWYGEGGIWEGPIGLITQDNYIQYWRNKRKMMQ